MLRFLCSMLDTVYERLANNKISVKNNGLTSAGSLYYDGEWDKTFEYVMT